jgi:hypothetical protein
VAKRKKGYRLSIETGKYTVGGAAVKLAKPTRAMWRTLKSLLTAFGKGDLIEQIPIPPEKRRGRPKKRR